MTLILVIAVTFMFQALLGAQHGGSVDPGKRPEKPPTAQDLPSFKVW